MSCKRCASDEVKTFNGELAIHFPGLEGLDKPIVWVFPKLVVCLGRGRFPTRCVFPTVCLDGTIAEAEQLAIRYSPEAALSEYARLGGSSRDDWENSRHTNRKLLGTTNA